MRIEMIRKWYVIVEGLLSLCLMIHAYENGGNWRYTVENYDCGVNAVTTKYEYGIPAPKDSMTREQLNQYLRDNLDEPEDDSPSVERQRI
jgi:hypothetical protein